MNRCLKIACIPNSFKQSLEWRKANRIDEIVGKWEPPVVLTKYYPMGVCGKFYFYANIKN